MARIRSFALWVEDLGKESNPQMATVDYIPVVTPQSSGKSVHDPNQTIDFRGPGRSSPIDPEVVQLCDTLHKIHGQLKDIFAALHAKVRAFRFPKMKTAFEKMLTAGVDDVGRAHAILLPLARGAEYDD